MALNKFQSLVKKFSQSPNVKKVIKDLQTLSTDVQKVAKTVNTDDAVKKYKEIMKKVTQREGQLEKEVRKMAVKFKDSASEVEKNLGSYKKMALQQKERFEKILKGKNFAPKQGAKASATKARATSTVKKAAKKATVKRSVRK
ncbi:MAG: hypothetical protein H7061_10770 [Bdellovibrionaceae bacterium]|nr:hypothetical protein [Bdellovibrio sp.]